LNSLTELKKIVESLNENITNEDILAFQKQISQLGQRYEGNPNVTTFLKMMRSLSKYLAFRKNNAHADSIPALNSIVEQLEKITNDSDLKEDDANQILADEIEKYKILKNKIASKPSITDSDINDLKAVILAIDWEISDTTLQNFETVTTNLLQQLKNYKIHYTFLKIIHSIGRYIGRKKANAPTDSISILRSVFENFEQIATAPDMTFKEKKQILGTDINRFYEFKQKIPRQKKVAHVTSDTSEDESFSPALSHIKKTSAAATGDVVPLTTLSEPEDFPSGGKTDSDTMAPALADKKSSSTGPRDIMDDLFSVKESPADELLDAIHLQDVPGQSQGQALNMLNQTRGIPSDGVKNLTLQRQDNEPIPEIGNRLDEFFNLEAPEESPVNVNARDAQSTEIDSAEDDSQANGIVPFQPEDESFEESPGKDDSDPLPQVSDVDIDILNRLKTFFETSESLQDRSSLLSINQDISLLEKSWENDPEKICLLQIISSLTNLLKNRPETALQENKSTTNEADKDSPDAPQEKTVGVLGKIKGIFTS